MNSTLELLRKEGGRSAKAIDPRSFHVFRVQDRSMLFDRATGALLKIDDPLREVLAAVEAGQTWDEVKAAAGPERADTVVAAQDFVEVLADNGLFRFAEVDLAEQQKMIGTLMRHKPRRIQMLMAQGCNLGCRYCYAWRNGSNQKNTLMSFEMAKASVDFLVKRSGSRPDLMVTFFGGEPFLNYGTVRKVVTYCRGLEETTGKKFTFEIITNGTLLNDRRIEYLAKHRFMVMLSLDGWEEMHNYNRPSIGEGNLYATILENARKLHERYTALGLPPVKVRANLTSKYHDASAVAAYFFKQGFKKIGIGAIEPLPHGYGNASALTEEQMDALAMKSHGETLVAVEKLRNGTPLTKAERWSVDKYMEAPATKGLKGLTCGVGRNTLIVDNKGFLYPCHRYEGMENYVLGNVLTGYDEEAAAGYYYKVNKNTTNRCHSCWVRDYCAGGCAWLLSAKDGHQVDPTVSECNRRRSSMERWLYVRSELRTILPPEAFERNGNRPLQSCNAEVTDRKEPCGCGS